MNNDEFRFKELADFLKTRRAKISPSEGGLPSAERRRTPGLRREEVAQLAGVGLTWYTWLEQGRDNHVSAQVIESLSRVLMLDKQERLHLFRLANQSLPSDVPESQKSISPILQHLLDSLVLCPSFIADQRWNVIAWNKAACILLGNFENMNARQRNVVWAMFTDDYFKRLYNNWDMYAKSLLGRFRLTCGKYIEDPWFAEFVEDLKSHSTEFAKWWSLHEIINDSGIDKHFNHPVAGELDFESSCFDVPDNSGYRLFVHVPAPGTDTSDKIKLLLNE